MVLLVLLVQFELLRRRLCCCKLWVGFLLGQLIGDLLQYLGIHFQVLLPSIFEHTLLWKELNLMRHCYNIVNLIIVLYLVLLVEIYKYKYVYLKQKQKKVFNHFKKLQNNLYYNVLGVYDSLSQPLIPGRFSFSWISPIFSSTAFASTLVLIQPSFNSGTP